VVPETVVERIATVDGVSQATGEISGYAQLVGSDGAALGGGDLYNAPEGRSLDWSAEGAIVAGRLPAGGDEVVVDRFNAEREQFTVGDEVEVVTGTGRAESFAVVGIIDLPDRRGAPTVGFDLPTAQTVLGRGPAEFDLVNVGVVDGANSETVGDHVSEAAGRGYEVVTSNELAGERGSDSRGELGYLTGLLLFIGFLALIIGGLIIRNTFTILVAQRTRELALLRCIGASPSQVRRAVLIEAGIVGIVGSAIGILVGIGLSRVLGAAIDSWGALSDLPAPTMRVTAWIVAVAIGVGLAATLLSALAPARRATRVAPVAALRDDPTGPDEKASRRRRAVGAAVVVLAVGSVVIGVANGSGTQVAVGALLSLVALEAVGSALTRPLARLIGVPLTAAFGVSGTLARQNARRNPRRTAATATALTIGVALSAFLAVWAESQKVTDHRTFDEAFTADYRINVPATRFAGPISPELVERLEALPELDAVTAFHSPRGASAADPRPLAALLGNDVTAGDLAALGPGTVAISADVASRRDLEIGSVVMLELSAAAGSQPLTVVALFDSYMLDEGLVQYAGAASHSLNVSYLLSPVEFERLGGADTIGWIYGRTADGVTLADADAAIEEVIAESPQVELQDRHELRSQGDEGVDSGLRLFYGLLGLLIVISLFGIVNTLALSIIERVHEIGLLRAIGLDRTEVRSMVRAEAVLIAVFGTIVGLVLGIVFVWAMFATATPGSDLDLDLAIPVWQLAVVAAFAVVASVVAAILPSIQATRVDALRAISTL
jgi:putative ABC transport system permease protein